MTREVHSLLMKTCSECKKSKSEDSFYIDYRNPEQPGLKSQCKMCNYSGHRRWKKNNLASAQESARRWYKGNKVKAHSATCKWKKENPEKSRVILNRYRSKRVLIDPGFRLRMRLRTRINMAVRAQDGKKAFRTIELLGCSIEHLRLWITFYFRPGMSWSNYGEWQIDHQRPCASFDLTDPTQQKECFHYTNLQPLWAEDNLRKGDKYGD